MRGCVAAGMCSAIDRLGLSPYIDVVCGSPAGSLVGAFFISNQLPLEGPSIYYEHNFTKAEKEFH